MKISNYAYASVRNMENAIKLAVIAIFNILLPITDKAETKFIVATAALPSALILMFEFHKRNPTNKEKIRNKNIGFYNVDECHLEN